MGSYKQLKMKIYRTFLISALACFALSVHAQNSGSLQAISTLDVPRYLGRWYEIAKFPNSFQKDCTSDTSANYVLRPDGQIEVQNQCRLADGRLKMAMGLARQLGGPTSAKLEVRFAPAWLSFLPFVWGDYWVVDLDAGYELVAVSEPGRQYLWILSRTPVVDEARYKALLQRLIGMGLDVHKLEKSVQSPKPSTSVSFGNLDPALPTQAWAQSRM